MKDAAKILEACSTPSEREERRVNPMAHREKWILRFPHIHAASPEHFELLLQGKMEPDELERETTGILEELSKPEWQAKVRDGYRDLYTHFAENHRRLRLLYPKLFNSIVSHPDRLEETRVCLGRLQAIWHRMLTNSIDMSTAMREASQIHREGDLGECVKKDRE